MCLELKHKVVSALSSSGLKLWKNNNLFSPTRWIVSVLLLIMRLYSYSCFLILHGYAFVGDIQSSKASNYGYNNNKHKLQQENLANNTLNDSSLSTPLPDKHLSLQMDKLPEGLPKGNTSNGGGLTKKIFYHHQQCRYKY